MVKAGGSTVNSDVSDGGWLDAIETRIGNARSHDSVLEEASRGCDAILSRKTRSIQGVRLISCMASNRRVLASAGLLGEWIEQGLPFPFKTSSITVRGFRYAEKGSSHNTTSRVRVDFHQFCRLYESRASNGSSRSGW